MSYISEMLLYMRMNTVFMICDDPGKLMMLKQKLYLCCTIAGCFPNFYYT